MVYQEVNKNEHTELWCVKGEKEADLEEEHGGRAWTLVKRRG